MSDNYSITLYHLFPDLLNLYGDKGNIAVFTKRCEWRGIHVEYRTLHENETPDFEGVDIVLLGGGSNREQLLVSKYAPAVSPALKEYVEAGGVLLAVCAGFQMLGKSYEADGQTIGCFGILDYCTISGEGRLIGNIAIEAELGGQKMLLTGFENHGGRTDIGSYTPLGKVVCGFGSDGVSGYEGVHYKNVIATYLHGPLLPKNPELADYLIEKALQKKYPDTFDGCLAPLDNTIEEKAKSFVIERELNRQREENK